MNKKRDEYLINIVISKNYKYYFKNNDYPAKMS